MKRFFLALAALISLALPAFAGGPGASVTGGAPYLDSPFLGIPSFTAKHFYHPPVYDACTLNGTTGTGDWVAASSVTVPLINLTPISASHPCTLQFPNGAAGNARIAGGKDAIKLGGGLWQIVCMVYYDALSDATNTYTTICGFHDATAGAINDGVVIRYTNGTNSGKFQCVRTVGGSETTTSGDTGVTVAINTWYELKVVIAADLSGATCYVNGAATAVNNTGMPTATDYVGYGFVFTDSAGVGTAAAVDLDYMEVLGGPFTTAR